MKLITFLILFPSLYFAQLSPQVKDLYQQISKGERAESSHTGMEGTESELYKLHKKLDEIANDKEVEYIAFNGNPVAKYYAANILFNRKSKSIEKIFEYYLKSKDSVQTLKGCVGGVSRLDYELYINVISEKQTIDAMQWEKKWKDSMITSGKQNSPEYLGLVDMLNTKTIWTKKDVDSLAYRLEQTTLNNHDAYKKLIELICFRHLHENKKVPYYEKIAYFDKKYSSEYIKKYLRFCRFGLK